MPYFYLFIPFLVFLKTFVLDVAQWRLEAWLVGKVPSSEQGAALGNRDHNALKYFCSLLAAFLMLLLIWLILVICYPFPFFDIFIFIFWLKTSRLLNSFVMRDVKSNLILAKWHQYGLDPFSWGIFCLFNWWVGNIGWTRNEEELIIKHYFGFTGLVN